eukprot:TRINITY_DN44773_c0_g1_i1.p1 TRINITY_DN44773_c0_g1~~TRINITY_DN44773_c0_g1_i1.p1  ORF type:complete len:328 (+),score=107.52 TRINITY_DN44773_c0_g1_i1:26-985(+)
MPAGRTAVNSTQQRQVPVANDSQHVQVQPVQQPWRPKSPNQPLQEVGTSRRQQQDIAVKKHSAVAEVGSDEMNSQDTLEEAADLKAMDEEVVQEIEVQVEDSQVADSQMADTAEETSADDVLTRAVDDFEAANDGSDDFTSDAQGEDESVAEPAELTNDEVDASLVEAAADMLDEQEDMSEVADEQSEVVEEQSSADEMEDAQIAAESGEADMAEVADEQSEVMEEQSSVDEVADAQMDIEKEAISLVDIEDDAEDEALVEMQASLLQMDSVGEEEEEELFRDYWQQDMHHDYGHQGQRQRQRKKSGSITNGHCLCNDY